VFASLNPQVPSLPEHLGAAVEFFDLFADLSPSGHIRVETGVTRYQFRGNWKQQVENSMDGSTRRWSTTASSRTCSSRASVGAWASSSARSRRPRAWRWATATR
jgi:hypothetical protein